MSCTCLPPPHEFSMPLLALAVVACAPGDTDDSNGQGPGETTDSHTGTNAAVTWHADVRPLVEEHCVNCHSEGEVAPFAFDDPDTAQALGPAIVSSVEEGSMPPFTWDDSCRQITNDLSLDPETIAVFTAWADEGYAQGDPESYVAPNLPEAVDPHPFDLTIYPQEPFAVDFEALDYFRCMVSDTVFEEDTWMVGYDTLLDNRAVMHHTIYYAVDETVAEELEALQGADGQPGIDCYGAQSGDFWPAVFSGVSVGGWAPGYEAWYQPDDSQEPLLARQIPAGSRIVFEMHYNALNATEDSATDQTGLGLWTLPEGEDPDEVLVGATAASYSIDIPAGEPEVHVEGTTQVRRSGTVLGTNPHMHTLGVALESWVTHEDGSETCLASVDPYDYNWQWEYTYAKPDRLELERTDTLNIRCTYDNSAENQPVINGVQREPRDVSYGDGTQDEMCFNFLTVSTPYVPEEE